MKKIKIFFDPIEQIPVWLNKQAQKGYRLQYVKGPLYSFEKSSTKVQYSVQFIGYDSNEKNKEYIDMLEDSGFRTFRAPLNQMNFSVGRIRLRPLADSGAKVATSFGNFNKEILIAESTGDRPSELLTTNRGKAMAYKKLRSAYLHGLIAVILLALLGVYKFAENNYTIDYPVLIFSGVILVFLIYIVPLVLIAHIKYKRFSNKSDLHE